MHAYMYISTKWLFEVRSDYVCYKLISCCCIGVVERDSHFDKDSSDFALKIVWHCCYGFDFYWTMIRQRMTYDELEEILGREQAV